jgi:hypothetical protein
VNADIYTWRSEPRTPYRVFPLVQPTMQAEGITPVVCTISSMLTIAREAAVPVYYPDSAAAEKADLREADWQESPHRIPDNITRRMLAWAEEYVRQHPDAPLIPRAFLSYRQNNYTAYKTKLISFAVCYRIENDARDLMDPAVKRARRAA